VRELPRVERGEELGNLPSSFSWGSEIKEGKLIIKKERFLELVASF